MRFAVEAWAPEYGSSMDAGTLETSEATVDITVESPATQWAPRAPVDDGVETRTLLFIDGVRRIDARVWITSADGSTRLGVCATYAAGVVRCNGTAEVVDVQVRRGLFTAAPDAEPIRTSVADFSPMSAAGDTPEQLSLALQQRMGELEVAVAQGAPDADLIVVDGPLSGRQNVPGAVGYVKSHRVSYLPAIADEVVAALRPGERTPLFLTTTSWSRFSWYLKLPGADGHPWAGVVRCEVDADQPVSDAIILADRASGAIPRFASGSHKDPRAPQNLYPIAGLERQLRRHSGDPSLIYRALRVAAANRVGAGVDPAPLTPPDMRARIRRFAKTPGPGDKTR